MKTFKLMMIALLLAGQSFSSTQTDIAWTIWAEARGEGQRGMALVASVIYNRSVERNMFVVDVCKQRKQFSCWNGVTNPKIPSGPQWEYCLILSRGLVQGHFKPFCNSNHYYNPRLASPSWGNEMSDVFYFKEHKFGRL